MDCNVESDAARKKRIAVKMAFQIQE